MKSVGKKNVNKLKKNTELVKLNVSKKQFVENKIFQRKLGGKSCFPWKTWRKIIFSYKIWWENQVYHGKLDGKSSFS